MIFRVFLLVGFVAANKWSYVQDLGKCSSLGPKYWCQTAENAATCHATNYCQEHVWNKELGYDTQFCPACKQGIEAIHSRLADKTTQAYIIMMLEKICLHVPPTAQNFCRSAVENYGQQFLDAILSYTADPQRMCVYLQFCNPSKLMTMIKIKAGTDYCLTCQQYVGTVHLLISNEESQKQIISSLESLCSDVPEEYSSLCSALVQMVAPRLMKWIVNYTADPSKFCTLIELCPSHSHPLARQQTREVVEFTKHVNEGAGPGPVVFPVNDEKVQATICSDCKQFTRSLYQIMSDQETQKEITSLFNKICNELPKSHIEECTLYVKVLLPMVLNFTVSEIASPNAFCSLLQFCSSNNHPVVKQQNREVQEFSRLISQRKHLKSIPDDICNVCLASLQLARDILRDPSVEKMVKESFENMCSYLPAIFFSKCLAYIDQVGPSCYTELINLLEPKPACDRMHLCNNSSQKEIKKFKDLESDQTKNKESTGGAYCETCVQVIKMVDDRLESKPTKDEVKKLLGEACDALASYSKECHSLVENYGPQLIDYIVDNAFQPEEICMLLNLCPSTQPKTSVKAPLKSPSVNGTVECEVCQYAMGYLDGMLKENSTQQEIQQALDTLCGYLPSQYKQECNDLVSSYSPVIIQLLLEELEPSLICKEIGMCVAVTSMKTSSLEGATECEICQYAMGYLDNMLKESSTQQEIKQALDALCGYLPSQYKEQCNGLVESYSPVIIQLLIQELDPSVICKLLNLCPAAQAKTSVKAPLKSPSVKGTVECEVCQYAMGYLDGMLKENSTQQEIQQALDTLCGYLPSQYKQECDDLVSSYSPVIIQLLLEELEPSLICKEIRMCVAVKSMKTSSAEGTAECEICQYAMGYLNSMLKENSTQQEIKQALDALCGYLPSQYKEQCNGLVESYSPVIIQLLTQELDPSVICKLLNLCPATHGKISIKGPLKRPSVKGKLECESCQYMIGYLDGMIKRKSSAQAMEQAVNRVCGYMLVMDKEECNIFASTYTPLIIQMISNGLEPSVICKEVGFCTAAKSMKTSVKRTTECEICQYAMGYLDSMLKKNSTEQQIQKALDALCGYLPSQYKQECNGLVENYSPVIIQLLIQELDPSVICKKIGMCFTPKSVKSVKAIKFKGVLECEACKYIMSSVDSLLKDKRTEESVLDALDKVCEMVPGTYRDECVQMINTYGPVLVELLIEELEPEAICQKIGLCTTAKAVKGEKLCELCQLLMRFVENVLKRNDTEETIQHYLEEACLLAPEQDRSLCKDLVDSYAPIITNMLIQQLEPGLVCKELTLCSAVKALDIVFSYYNEDTTKPKHLDQRDKYCLTFHPFKYAIDSLRKSHPTSHIQSPKLANSLGESVECELCQYAMGYLDTLLGEKATEDEIVNAVKNLCLHLPEYINTQCVKLVNEYGDEIIQMLVKDLNPGVVCNALKLCQSSNGKHHKHVLTMRIPHSGPSCVVCDYAMGYLHEELESASVKKDIEALVENLCSHLPSAFKNECDALITEYGDEIIDLIAKQVEPNMICKELHLC